MKAIVIISGGMDSVTLLHHLKAGIGNECKALTFDYGQKHKKEIEYAKKACEKLGVEHTVVDLTGITKLISNSALTGNVEMPIGHYASENMKLTVVPNRNMIMLSIAIGYAENLKYDCVAIASHAGDHYIYPDCRPEFNVALEEAAKLGTFNKIGLYRPFQDIDKGKIGVIGLDLGIDYDKETWTCYEGKEKPCGKCGACNERKEALEYAKWWIMGRK